jgi:hypothetical protein
MKRSLQFALLTLAAIFTLLPGSVALAQRKVPPAPPRPKAQPQRPAPLAKKPNPPTRQMLDLPPKWIEQVQNMSPAEQERFMANNERFRSLPPQRQEQIRRRLQALNNLSPEQRQAVLERQQVWEQMTPAQQRYVRETLLPQWQTLPAPRRQIVLQKLRAMRDLDDAQRAEKLNSSFVNGLSPDEQHMLRDLSNLRVSGPEPPPGL